MKTLAFFLFLLCSGNITCQDFDDIIKKVSLDCSDVSYGSALLFQHYVEENKLDSAEYIITYWANRCGKREPVFRAKILLALIQGNFHDSLLTETPIYFVLNYRNRIQMIESSNYYIYDYYKPYYGFIPPGQGFDSFTINQAERLLTKYNPETIEYLLCEFYGNNSEAIFFKLKNNDYRGSLLVADYRKNISELLEMPELHMSIVSGLWIPTGNLKTLGLHPELGFQIGAKYLMMNYDLILAFRFLKSPNEYLARRTKSGDLIEATDYFFGGHIGIAVGRDIYTHKNHEVQLTGGIAFDGFDALKEDKDRNLKAATVWSYNLSLGLSYRYYFSSNNYFGIRAKYNLVDYTLNNVIDFTDNPITLHLIFGWVNNDSRNSQLKQMYHGVRGY
ncbi:MAG: hypothetical protein R6W68_11865 [Ignavibacteriaceae bacterium]